MHLFVKLILTQRNFSLDLCDPSVLRGKSAFLCDCPDAGGWWWGGQSVHHVCAGSAMAALGGLPGLPSMYSVLCSTVMFKRSWPKWRHGRGRLFSSKNCPTSQKIQVPQSCLYDAEAYKLLFSLAKAVTKATRHRWLQYKLKRQKEWKVWCQQRELNTPLQIPGTEE